jgi:hypothetical protein
MLKKKIWASFQRIRELLPKNLSLSSKKYGVGIWDPGSGIPGPGVKKAPDPGCGSATLASRSQIRRISAHLCIFATGGKKIPIF